MRVTKLSSVIAAMCLVAASAPWLSAQIVSSTLTGTVVDPANAVIGGADATLKDQSTGAERSAKTNGEGSFRFLDIGAGTYTLTVKANGFRTHVQKDIEVQTSATRDIGRVAMELGNITDQITVTADAANVELSSSEKAHSVDITQIENIPSRGRDLFAFVGTLPGMIDTNNANTGVGTGSHDFRNAYSVGGLSMNGNQSMMNVTVDGLTGMDVGCGNCLLEGNPNMDAVSEVKVLSSNYSAEYGRNSGGTITLATKSGTQDFHGSGWWQHRHEEFNANTFFNNISGTQRPKYRFNIDGYSIGGPVYIPKHFNTGKTKLFFFASEEWSGLFPGANTVLKNMPTALERTGDFSQSRDVNGKLIVVNDPLTNQPFADNVIPASRFDPTGVGPKIVNFFPLPNYAPPQGNPNYRKYNYQALIGGKHPIRNDVARVDLNPTSKIAAYIRMVRDDDTTTDPQAGFDFVYSPQTHPVPSYNYSGAITYTIRPTLVNEFNFGKAGSDWNYYYNDPSNLARSVFNNPPKLFPVQFNDPSTVSSLSGSNLHMYNFIPNVGFGSIPSSATGVSLGRETPNPVHNYSIVDNISWIKGKHTIKAGIYEEYAWKYQPSGGAYTGSYNFGNDNNNTSFGSQNGYSNALLGYFASYSEQNLRLANIVDYWNSEWYVQDSWKASNRLTFDLGVRFYNQTPQVDENGTWAIFDPKKYDPAKAPRLYAPAVINGQRLAQDPVSKSTAPASAIGSYVPGSGDIANGMIPLGKGQDAYHQTPAVVAAPRLGFAYDLFGDGKTALRGGFGIFYNRVNGNSVYGMTGNPPNTVTATVYDSTISALAPGQGYSSPPNIGWYSDGQWDSERNASLGIQRNLGWGTTLDVSWVANWGVNQPWTININPIPIGADFDPKNADPTKKNAVLPSVFERVNYPGWGNLTEQAWGGSTNYHSLQTQIQHRFRGGFEFNANYTWSHALGVTGFQPLVADNTAYNYGPLGTDRRHVFSVNYIYNLPGLGHKMNSKFVGFFVDHWVLAGIVQAQSGAPFTPSFTTSPSLNITGTGSLGARINVVGDAHAAPPQQSYNGLPVQFNVAAFAEPAVGAIGNAGVNMLRQPGWTNFDANLAKRFPVGNEKRAFVVRFEGYNVFNHPEFTSLSSQAKYDANHNQIEPTFGTPNTTRPARILSGVLRFEF